MARVLVLGGGAREHALGHLFQAHELTFIPGNAGTAALGKNIEVDIEDPDALVVAAKNARADLVIIGPEKPLVNGIADSFIAAGVRVFGPRRHAARLEGEKSFMKDFCARHDIPTAAYRVFDDANDARNYVQNAARPLVVKADGLCAGKGVVVAKDTAEALAAIQNMMVARAFGDAGARVVIEEILPGEEASFHVLVANGFAAPLASAQDHKRIFDGDKGPNTGGMGAYAPALVVTPEVHARVMNEIVAKVVLGFQNDGIDFRGVLFVGLMIEDGTPRVLEFNVRFGDPEASVILPLLEGDPLEIFMAVADGDLSKVELGTLHGAALTVVLAAENYPSAPTTGDVIEGLDAPLPDGAFVLHAGTKKAGNQIVTAGGRVLAVGARAESFRAAHTRAYAVVENIRFRGMQFRRDIGQRALTRI